MASDWRLNPGQCQENTVKMGRTVKPFVKILERFKVVPQRAFQTDNRISKKLKGVGQQPLTGAQRRPGHWFPNCALGQAGAHRETQAYLSLTM